MNSITEKELTWLDDHTPVSKLFDDSFFSRHDGRSETQSVFIDGNQLPERWRETSLFIIGELGFGTGLNFLETMHQWLRNKAALETGKLIFISFEKYPLKDSEIIKTISRWEELIPLAQELIRYWPPQESHQIFEFGSVELHLFIGDARLQIKKMRHCVDCWYLDGFNPAKNPELWELELIQDVFDRTHAGGTFSTYTSAGFVKRNLISAGFDVKKVPGFRYKRERLEGQKPVS